MGGAYRGRGLEEEEIKWSMGSYNGFGNCEIVGEQLGFYCGGHEDHLMRRRGLEWAEFNRSRRSYMGSVEL